MIGDIQPITLAFRVVARCRAIVDATGGKLIRDPRNRSRRTANSPDNGRAYNGRRCRIVEQLSWIADEDDVFGIGIEG